MGKIQFVIYLLIGLFLADNSTAQSNASIVLSPEESKTLFSKDLLSALDLSYPIRRVYKCTDSTGNYFIVLTESNDSVTPSGDTLHYKLKAAKLVPTHTGFRTAWSFRDHVDTARYEKSIWFWTKYCQLSDLDNDGMIDPIIVYGSSALNSIHDGRTKFLIFYKDQKVAIRHQNGVLDFERNTTVDSTFYNLPRPIQTHVQNLINDMESNNHLIFPYQWEDAMGKRKMYFDEN